MYLIIDTSVDLTFLSLVLDNSVFYRKQQSIKEKQSRLLLSLIDQFILENKKTKKDLRGIVVISGPGSYTGLRVSIATANALMMALDIPLCGINKYQIASFFYPDKLLAIPAYGDYYLVAKSGKNKRNDFKYQMTRETDLLKMKSKVIVIGKRVDEKKDFQTFNYRKKENIILWFREALKNLEKKPLQPFYFQSPNVTFKKR